MAPLQVVRVPALQDNYIWIAHEPASGRTVVIDPGEAGPTLAAADAQGWGVDAIWITHWHPDHTGGIAEIKASTGAKAWGPAAEAARIPPLDHLLAPGDELTLGPLRAEVIATPGHTLGHIAFHLAQAEAVFVGDTLFAMGCGRLFEGTPEQLHGSLQRLAALPGETVAYPAHEYTAGNARFALSVDPDNRELRARADEVERLRAAGEPTLPTTIALECATNPFVRAPDAEALARLRAAKDRFAG